MATTARIANVKNGTKIDDLIAFLEKELPLSPYQLPSLAPTPTNHQVATVTFLDNATLKLALHLSPAKKRLGGRPLNIDDEFKDFTVLSDGKEVDVVALHGLDGHAFNTWEYRKGGEESFMWLRDGLPEQIPGARIMIYGYDADLSSTVQTGRLQTLSETFLSRLTQLREDSEAQNRPLVLIGYAMGGLIIKQALLVARIRTDGIFAPTLNSVIGIIFLGTPHQDPPGVDTTTAVQNFIYLQQNPQTALLEPLKPGSFVLFDQTQALRQLLEDKRIAISTLYETRMTIPKYSSSKTPFLVVQEQSAVLGLARETKVGVDADHKYLCKFRNNTDSTFNSVARTIRAWSKAAKLVTSTENASSLSTPPVDTDAAPP